MKTLKLIAAIGALACAGLGGWLAHDTATERTTIYLRQPQAIQVRGHGGHGRGAPHGVPRGHYSHGQWVV